MRAAEGYDEEGHGRSATDVLDGLRWLIGLRWVSAAAILAAGPLAWLAPRLFRAFGGDFVRADIRAPVVVLASFALLIATLNAGYWLAWRRLDAAEPSPARTRLVRLLAHLQVSLDLLTITALAHFLGGFESPTPLFMLFHMICVASILTPRAAYAQATFGLALLVTLAQLEARGLLPHRALVDFEPPIALHRQPSYLGLYLIITACMLGITVFLTNYLADKVRREQRRVRSAEREASTDGLTGLANHRQLERRLREELSRSRRHGSPLSVVMIDVDCFKRFNDAFGHLAGDEVLRGLARLLGEQVRATDMAARYGGEEFALVLPDTPEEPAREVAERIRRRVRERGLGDEHGHEVTISAGVATWRPNGSEETPDKLVGRADRALYDAKEGGRDRVCAAPASGITEARSGRSSRP